MLFKRSSVFSLPIYLFIRKDLIGYLEFDWSNPIVYRLKTAPFHQNLNYNFARWFRPIWNKKFHRITFPVPKMIFSSQAALPEMKRSFRLLGQYFIYLYFLYLYAVSENMRLFWVPNEKGLKLLLINYINRNCPNMHINESAVYNSLSREYYFFRLIWLQYNNTYAQISINLNHKLILVVFSVVVSFLSTLSPFLRFCIHSYFPCAWKGSHVFICRRKFINCSLLNRSPDEINREHHLFIQIVAIHDCWGGSVNIIGRSTNKYMFYTIHAACNVKQ